MGKQGREIKEKMENVRESLKILGGGADEQPAREQQTADEPTVHGEEMQSLAAATRAFIRVQPNAYAKCLEIVFDLLTMGAKMIYKGIEDFVLRELQGGFELFVVPNADRKPVLLLVDRIDGLGVSARIRLRGDTEAAENGGVALDNALSACRAIGLKKVWLEGSFDKEILSSYSFGLEGVYRGVIGEIAPDGAVQEGDVRVYGVVL